MQVPELFCLASIFGQDAWVGNFLSTGAGNILDDSYPLPGSNSS